MRDPAHITHGLQPRRSRRVLSIELLERWVRKRERNRLWMARWRNNNPELARQRGREWDAKHPGKNAEQLRGYYLRHKVRHTEKVNRWQNENREKVRGYVRKSMRLQIANLTDYYVRSKLTRDGMIKRDEWPASLVNLKRAQLKLTRLCRKSRTTTN
jgi:hypothetical protein